MPNTPAPIEITVAEAKQLADASPDEVELIDVREPHEREICGVAGSTHVPMGQIPASLDSLSKNKHLLIYCHHGGRSLRVTQYLRAQGFSRVTNIAGGIDAWAQEIEPGMPRY